MSTSAIIFGALAVATVGAPELQLLSNVDSLRMNNETRKRPLLRRSINAVSSAARFLNVLGTKSSKWAAHGSLDLERKLSRSDRKRLAAIRNAVNRLPSDERGQLEQLAKEAAKERSADVFDRYAYNQSLHLGEFGIGFESVLQDGTLMERFPNFIGDPLSDSHHRVWRLSRMNLDADSVFDTVSDRKDTLPTSLTHDNVPTTAMHSPSTISESLVETGPEIIASDQATEQETTTDAASLDASSVAAVDGSVNKSTRTSIARNDSGEEEDAPSLFWKSAKSFFNDPVVMYGLAAVWVGLCYRLLSLA